MLTKPTIEALKLAIKALEKDGRWRYFYEDATEEEISSKQFLYKNLYEALERMHDEPEEE